MPVEPQRDAVAEKAADAEKTQFMLDALRKGIPAFNRVIEKATDGQRAAMADRLRAMLDAKSANSPVWGGQPPKDMDAFTARANLALERLTGGVLAKKGVIQENPVRFDKKGKVEATLAAKKKARPAEKPVDEPVKAAPQNILEGAIKRHTEYLENPPDDYTPAEAQKRGQWAEKQLARVQAELDKLKGSDDYDRQDQLSDYKSALKRLVAKAKEIVEADVHLEKELGPQDGEAKYNAQVPYAKDNPYGGVRDGRDNFQAGHLVS